MDRIRARPIPNDLPSVILFSPISAFFVQLPIEVPANSLDLVFLPRMAGASLLVASGFSTLRLSEPYVILLLSAPLSV